MWYADIALAGSAALVKLPIRGIAAGFDRSADPVLGGDRKEVYRR
jgi:hypothetical protein